MGSNEPRVSRRPRWQGLALAATGGCFLAGSCAQEPAGPMVKVASGFRFVEGPAWNPVSGELLFTDIPNERIVRLSADGKVSTFLEPSGRANGLVFDAEGNLYACLGGARQVVRIAPGGERTVLASTFEGNRLNSPNDLALDEHGGIYFTDPRFGNADDVEQPVMGVYYVAPRSGAVTRVIDELRRPNGIVVARDGSGVYVAEPDERALHYYPILAPGKVGHGKVLFQGDPDLDGTGPDGMCLDRLGNVYATYEGIVVFDAMGRLLRRIPVPERPANCAFGGADGRTLFVTARTSLYRMVLDVAGAPARSTAPRAVAVVPVLPAFDRVAIDEAVGIGYGVAVADVDGDGAPDLVLVDKDVVAWYRNPSWQKHVIARRLTEHDHVCVAAADLDGDGKAEIAVGAGWNPADTVGSGSVHYLVAPADRTGPWSPVPLPHEPTVHRMRWLRGPGGKLDLVVVPLHGRGNRGARGAGARILLYEPRLAEPDSVWPTEPIDETLHETHNVDPVQWDADPEDEMLVAAREGLFVFDRRADGWTRTQLAGSDEGESESDFTGASEARAGVLPGGRRFLASVEPFHGNQVVVWVAAEEGSPRRFWRRTVVDDTLAQGHAVACGDLLGVGSDQLVVGWREKNGEGEVGVRVYVPLDGDGRSWRRDTLDDGGMACEDLRLGDLDGDGDLDVVAAGRATRNLVVYFNRR